MSMREECKNFQSRTYSSGEVARFCVLDLAPEAPWRCPADCKAYEPRLADAGWVHGSLVDRPVEEEPDLPGGDIASLLGDAEEVVNEAAPSILAEVHKEDEQRDRRENRAKRSWWHRRR
jgi:hypothetical protein